MTDQDPPNGHKIRSAYLAQLGELELKFIRSFLGILQGLFEAFGAIVAFYLLFELTGTSPVSLGLCLKFLDSSVQPLDPAFLNEQA